MTTDGGHPASRLDALDRRLIAELEAEPRETYATLGTRLGVTGMTVANRLQRLRSAELVTIEAVPNLPQFGLTTEVIGMVQTETSGVGRVESTLAASKNVLRVYRVTGEFDLAFDAAFGSEAEMGELVRAIHAVQGMRRLVVYHRIQTVKDDHGWRAVWAGAPADAGSDAPYELATGTVVPRHLEESTALAARWVSALAACDVETLRQLSCTDVSFTIMEPHPSAGTFSGLAAVEKQAERTRRAYNRLWYRLIAVTEGQPPYRLVLDALSPVEDRRGHVGTAFSRMAFAFSDGRVSRVLSLGEMELAEFPETHVRATDHD